MMIEIEYLVIGIVAGSLFWHVIRYSELNKLINAAKEANKMIEERYLKMMKMESDLLESYHLRADRETQIMFDNIGEKKEAEVAELTRDNEKLKSKLQNYRITWAKMSEDYYELVFKEDERKKKTKKSKKKKITKRRN